MPEFNIEVSVKANDELTARKIAYVLTNFAERLQIAEWLFLFEQISKDFDFLPNIIKKVLNNPMLLNMVKKFM